MSIHHLSVSCVTRADVVAAYQDLLGRLPESEQAIQGYLTLESVAHMHEFIKNSAEYKNRTRALVPQLEPAQAPVAVPLSMNRSSSSRKVERVAFVGNCQTNVLAALTNAMQNQVEATGFELTSANLAKLTKQSSAQAPWCDLDVIWAHPHHEWAVWLQGQPAEFRAKVHSLPTIDTLGFHPDCVYVRAEGKVIDSPIGAYHSLLVLWGFMRGYTPKQIEALFCAPVFEHLGYFDFHAAGINNLVNKGRVCGMPMSTWLASWQAQGVWMHTINHPRPFALADVAQHCLALLGIRGVAEAHAVVSDELALSACWPVYPDLAQRLGFPLRSGSYSFKCQSSLGEHGKPVRYMGLIEFIERSCKHYEKFRASRLSCERLESASFESLPSLLADLARGTAPPPHKGNPYTDLPDHRFWRRSVERVAAEDQDPVVAAPFHIGPADKVATAGSCFAQHIARTLAAKGFHYLVTERADHLPQEQQVERNYGVFSARFGNIYTARQLRQLQELALGEAVQPAGLVWLREDGRYIDGLRPYVEPQGFATPDEALSSRQTMLSCVSDMLQGCDVLVFTLGLTEGWHRLADGVVVPIAPGVVTVSAPMQDFGFVNFSVDEVLADMRAFLWTLKSVNRRVKVVLTVSPVPLMATYENRSVVASTVYSKSVLRTVAGMLEAEFDWVAYFASYEVITAGPNASRYFGPDRRSVTEEGVAHVMRLFMQHFAQQPTVAAQTEPPMAPAATGRQGEVDRATQAVGRVVCDEEHLDAAGAR